MQQGRWTQRVGCAVAVVLLSWGGVAEASTARDAPLTARRVAFVLQYGPGPVTAPPPEAPAARDRWVAMDKAKHLGGSFLWTLSTQYVLVVKAGWSDDDALPLSVASAGAAGVAKEIYDRTLGPTKYFSAKDLVADAAGIVLAAGVILLL